MNFREELNSIKETNSRKFSIEDRYYAEYILEEIVISYLRYLIATYIISSKIEIIFSVESTYRNTLHISVKSSADNYIGRVIYYQYFPTKNGAMFTTKKIEKILQNQGFEIIPYHNNPRYTRYYDKRFSVFIEI